MNAKARVDEMLAAVASQWQRRQMMLLLGAGVVSLLAWLLTMVVTDNLLILDRSQLLSAWVVLGVCGAMVSAAAAHRFTAGKPDTIGFARLYERGTGGRGDRLVNAAQFLLGGRAETDPAAWAVVTENAATLSVANARDAFDWTPVRRAWTVGAALLVLFSVYCVARPAAAMNAVSRLLQPFAPPAHLLATEFVVSPGDVEIVEGQTLPIKATLLRNVPTEAWLEYRVGELGWTREPMQSVGDGVFGYDKLASVTHPVRYRVVAGRSVSDEYKATVKLRPRVEKLQVTVTPPAYVGEAATPLREGVGDVSALIGSTVQIKLTCNSPLKSGTLDLGDGTTPALSIDERDPRVAGASFVLSRSGGYAIGLTDRTGLSNVSPARFALTAVEDAAPIVLVSQPARDLILPIDATLPVAIEAQDDHGLAKISLQVRTGQGDWRDVTGWDVAERSVHRKGVTANLEMKKLDVKVGDVVLYRALASDRCEPRAGVGISRVWSITISESSGDQSLAAAQARRLLEAVRKILALQRENRVAVDMDQPTEPIAPRQSQVRELTLAAIDMERKSVRPMQSALDELASLADGPMIEASKLTATFRGAYEVREKLKPPVLKVMDEIITRLESLTGRLSKSLALAEAAQQAATQMSAQDREQAIEKVRSLLEKLRKFKPEQDKIITDTEELARKGDNLTDPDKQKLDLTRGTEDAWGKVFTASVKDIEKLTEQGFGDRTMTSDYKEMVQQIEAAALNMKPKLVEMAVPREQMAREMAEKLAEDMQMWLPNSPDNLKWVMEEPLDKPAIPMPELPDQLRDMIGDLLEQQEELNEAADDKTSAWADSMSAAGWGVADGPISNFSAKGVTGNQVPNNNEISGRSGDGRSGRSSGQMVGDTAKGLAGRQTPTRVTNDPYEQGVVKELQKLAASGSTGGGKARGSGQEGLQGEAPPPIYKDMQYMKDWQQKLRQKAERIAGDAKAAKIRIAELDKGIELMKDAEAAAKDGRYGDLFKKQQMILSNLKMAADAPTRDVALRIDQARRVPESQKKQMLDAMDEPVPQEFEGAVRRYFMKLSDDK